MSARRLMGLARVSLSPAQQWKFPMAEPAVKKQVQAMRHHERTFSAQDGRDDTENIPAHGGHSYPRNPEIPNLRMPRVGTSGLGYGRNVAGDTNRTVAVDSTYLGQADDVHAKGNAYNDNLRNGSNAGVHHSDSKAPPPDQGLHRPDFAHTSAVAMSQMAPNNAVTATDQRSGDIPRQHDSSVLSGEYHLHKARIHATLWQRELRKQAGDLEGNADFSRYGKESCGWDADKMEGWEAFDPPESEFYDASPAKEENLMYEEFEKRRERNRIQIASFVKEHLYGRRRPVDGWKYIINNFGRDSKAAKGTGLGGRQTAGNDLEKLALKRESSRLRKK